MIAFETGFWDVAAGLGQGGAGAILALCVVFWFQSKQKNGNGKHCQAQQVETAMQLTMKAHTILLEDIKDSNKDVRDGVNMLVTLQRNRGNH